MSEFWKGLLDQAREESSQLKAAHGKGLISTTDTTGEQETLLLLCSHFHDVQELVLKYIQTILAQSQNNGNGICNDDEFKFNEQQPIPKSTKILIVDTRRALRFLLCLLSIDAEVTRLKIQCITTNSSSSSPHKWSLQDILSQLIALEACDRKCRLIASQVLCNIGTSNPTTASNILQNIKTSPSDDEASKLMLRRLSLQMPLHEHGHEHGDNDGHEQLRVPLKDVEFPRNTSTWTEMIHTAGSQGDRSALAAIIAALYNCLAAIEDNKDFFMQMAVTISSDKMLICNLMRYILPSSVIQPDGGHGHYHGSNDSTSKAMTNDHSDDATEWVTRVVEKLCTFGMLPSMYKSLGGCSDGVTPEQLILLHCVGSAVEEYTKALHTKLATGLNPLGGACDEDKLIATYDFLASQWVTLRQHSKGLQTKGILGEKERYPGEMACVEDASNVIIDMLSSGAATDDKNNSAVMLQVRLHLGRNTHLLQEALADLGLLVDRLGIENRGISARELKISDGDQNLVTSIVRMIGNVCFRCKENQDMVRSTIIPVPRINIPHAKEYTPQISKGEDGDENVRNGLHVLLSCTSFAYGCFTLREWAIVAIRNVLEGNDENQKVVEELEAQQALQTPELQKLGVKVKLDKKGQVHVSQPSPPLRKDDNTPIT